MTATTVNRDSFPTKPLFAIGLLLVVAVVSVTAVRLTKVGTDDKLKVATIIERTLRFEDRDNGSIVVLDAKTRAEVAQIAPGTNGFLRSTLRGLARERKRRDIGAEPPFVLSIRADGRLTLADPATVREVDLEAFGPTNATVFRHFLPGTQMVAQSPGVTTIKQ
jgi:putative photosynthetic complex assembly protein